LERTSGDIPLTPDLGRVPGEHDTKTLADKSVRLNGTRHLCAATHSRSPLSAHIVILAKFHDYAYRAPSEPPNDRDFDSSSQLKFLSYMVGG
jgi:hypothetical protein